MASSIGDPQKTQISKLSAQRRRDKGIEPITSVSSHVKELPLRTSLVRDSVKKRIFACMDKGDTSADIEYKSDLSHLIVKHYRRLWKDERHDPRLRSKKRSRRGAQSQLPLKPQSTCGPTWEEFSPVRESARDKEKRKRKHRAAKGLKEREENPRVEDAGSRVQETSGMQIKPSEYPLGAENQLVIRLSDKPTQ